MKFHHSVKIVAKNEGQKEQILSQIKSLLKHIDSYIEGTRPKRTSILIGIMFHFPNMGDKKISQAERDALESLERLYLLEKNLWEDQERHSLNKNTAKTLSNFLRGNINEATIKIRQFYVSRKDKAWRELRVMEAHDNFFDEYYNLVKQTYTLLFNILKDANVDSKPLQRGR